MGLWQVAGSAAFEDLESVYGFKITQFPGAGMAPVTNISSTYGLLDGALFQRTHTEPKQFTLIGTLRGTSVADLHQRRRNLISVIAPDRSGSPGEPLILRYTGGASTLSCSAYYRSGLELGNVRSRTESNIAFAFDQFDPYWEKITSSSANLTVQSTVASVSGVMARSACGVWSNMNSGVNSIVSDMIAASDGTIFVSGNFDRAGSTGTSACRIAQWKPNGVAWSAVGNGMNDTVSTLDLDSQGRLVAGGYFTTASNITACRIARWTGTAWQTIGSSGLNNRVNRVHVLSNGYIVAAGSFSKADTINASCIAQFNGADWAAMSNGVRGQAWSFEETIGGCILTVVGKFDVAGTGTACNLAVWSGTAWSAPVSIFTGTNFVLNDSIRRNNGDVIVGGLDGAGTRGVLYTFNGATATQIASANNDILYLSYDTLRDISYVSGNFTTIAGINISYNARLKGNTSIVPVDFDANTYTTAVVAASDGTLYIGHQNILTASVAAVTAVTNSGTATTYPIFTASAPTSSSTATLRQLVNYTTGDELFFNLTLQAGEVITLDLRPGNKTLTSNIRGNIINTLLPGSNIATWKLAPGANNISMWLTGGSGAARLSWTERFWSIDN